MKMIVTAIAAVCMVAVMGVESFNTDFTVPAGAKSWCRDNFKGLEPFPKFGFDANAKAFVVGKAVSNAGTVFKNQNQCIDAKKGDTILVKFEVKGKGRFFITTEFFSGSKWTGMGVSSKDIVLKPEWTKGEVKLQIADLKGGATTKVMIDFGSKQGSEFQIKNISATRVK